MKKREKSKFKRQQRIGPRALNAHKTIEVEVYKKILDPRAVKTIRVNKNEEYRFNKFHKQLSKAIRKTLELAEEYKQYEHVIEAYKEGKIKKLGKGD